MIFHSCLHLCGYEDKNAVLKAKMRIKEDKYLKILLHLLVFHVKQFKLASKLVSRGTLWGY